MKKEYLVFDTDVSIANIRDIDRKRLAAVNAKIIGMDLATEDDYIKYAKDADFLYTVSANLPISKRVLKSLPKLKAVVRHGIGYGNIDIKAAKELGIIVSNCPGFCADEVSTHGIALLLSYTRGIVDSHNWTREGNWRLIGDMPPVKFASIYNKSIGIIGFGHIGSRVFEKLLPYKPKIYVYDPFIKSDKSPDFEQTGLVKLLRKSQYIIIACAQTEKTFHLLDEKQFSYMRSDAVIINIARGGIINEKVLIKYLTDNKIEGAALDVFEDEPMKPDNPLLKLKNVIITPHTAAYSPESLDVVKTMVIDEIIRIIKGKKPLNQVNK
jgi:D-3-phosphoglycerate dehydrogenase / 2-oxoglutarate reductase